MNQENGISNIDYMGMAEMILESFEGAHPDLIVFTDPGDQDVKVLSELIEELVDEDTAEGLSHTKVGRGVLLGMSAIYKELQKDDTSSDESE